MVLVAVLVEQFVSLGSEQTFILVAAAIIGGYMALNIGVSPTNCHWFPLFVQDAFHGQRNGDWGLRHLDQVEKLGAEYGLKLDRLIEMPSNNLSVIFIKT